MIKYVIKKVLFILFAIVILNILSKSNCVFSANYQNYEYRINNDNSTVTITGYLGSSKEITIPSSIPVGVKEYNVISVSENAFYGNTKLTKVIIPDTIISIGNDAFANCSSNLIIYAANNSDAIDYAKSNNIKYLITAEEYAYDILASSNIDTVVV